ncbi:hypothetical protein JCM8097_003551 [Rhodosporidiobolus ruineniae]
MAVDSRSVDQVTCLCYARGLPAATWLSLVQQAAQAADTGAQKLEEEVAASLLALLEGSAPPPPVVLQYLQTAISTAPTSSTTAARLVRPGYLARQAATSSSLHYSAAESVFHLVLNVLDRTPKESSLVATSAEDFARTLLLVLDHLLPVAVSSSASAGEWLARLLTKPPYHLSKKTLSADLLEKCSAALQAAIEQVGEPVKPGLARLKAALALAHRRLSGGGRRRAAAPINLDDAGRSLTVEPDALLLSSFLLSNPILPTSNVESRLQAFLAHRADQAPARGSTLASATTRALAELLLSLIKAASQMRREDKAIEGLLFAKFSDNLAAALRLVYSALVTPSPASGDAMDEDGAPVNAVPTCEKLVTALSQHGTISFDTAASLASGVDRNELEPVQPPDLAARLAGSDPDELKQVLEELVAVPATQRAAAFAIRDTIASLATSSPPDLPNLASTCEILSEDKDSLAVLLLHVEPKEILKPVRQVLDSVDIAQDEYGENATERYGALVLFVQVVVSRFGLYSNLAYHLGSASSFFTAWMPAATATYPLSVMTDDERAAVGGWIAALFGEGISDDLMHATNPRTLLRVAPTILKQSLMACQVGVVDLDNLRDALSYFLQELLRFTLPGVLRWLIEEIGRTPSGTPRNSMLDILQVFIFSPELPQPVLELISPDLARLAASLPSPSTETKTAAPGTPNELDPEKVRKLVAPFRPKKAALRWAEPTGASWTAALLTTCTALIDSPPSPSSADPFPNLSRTLSSALSSARSPTTFLRDSLLSHLCELAVARPAGLSVEEEYLRLSRIRRAGIAVLSFSPPSAGAASLPPLLQPFVADVLLPSFPSWARQRLPATTPTSSDTATPDAQVQTKLELLADLLGGTVVSVLGSAEENEAAKRLLERVRAGAEKAMKAQGRKRARMETAEAEEEKEDDSSTALVVFLDRLVGWMGAVEACPGLAELVEGVLS